MKSTKFILLLFPAIVLFSCNHQSITGGGNIITEERTIPATINSVLVQGSCNVEIYYAAVPELELTGYENLMEYYKTDIGGNWITVRTEENTNLENDNVTVKIGIPVMSELIVEGSGAADVQNHTLMLTATRIEGSGTIHFQNTVIRRLHTHIEGSGEMTYSGSACDTLIADIEGSGITRMHVNNLLEGTIVGSGIIYYGGNPLVESHITGSGSIEPE